MPAQLSLWCEGRHKSATPATHAVTVNKVHTRSMCGPCTAYMVTRGIALVVSPIEAYTQPRPVSV